MEPLKIQSFDELTLEQVKTIIGAGAAEKAASLWKFYRGDHWQGGDGWVGPRLPDGTAGAAEMLAEVERAFIFSNVSREITDRHADAVTNREPRWGAVLQRVLGEDEQPTDDETARIGELDGLMTQWWDTGTRCTYTDAAGNLRACSAHELLQQVSRRYAATGRVNLRLFIPPSHIDENGTLPSVPLTESLDRVYIELCEPESASTYIDRRRMQQVGVYLWRDGDTDVAELSYLADDGSTILRQIKGNEDAQAVPAFALSGNLLHFEATGDGVLSDSIVAQQKDLNRALTMGGRAMNLSGFPERVLFDVQLDGQYVADPENPGKKKLVPNPIGLGAGTTNNLQGIEYKDEEGKVRRTSPRYERLDPPGTRIFGEAVAEAARRIRDEAKQSHVEMSSDATSSGRSREQARWEFIQSVAQTVAVVNRAGRWLLTTALLLAVATSSDGGNRFDDLKFDFACRIDPGPVSAEDRGEDRAQVEAQLLSRETAMTRAGVDDVDAEISRIAAENEGSLAVMENRAQVMQLFTASGAGVEASAVVAGFDDEQAARLGRGDFVDGVSPEPAEPASTGGG